MFLTTGPDSSHKSGGFTLIEVLVALAIVTLGMFAVVTQLNRYAMSASYIEQKTLASWIATNTITELSIDSEWAPLGTSELNLEFANRLWRWRAEVTETEIENLRRVDVYVSLSEEPQQIIHRVSGLLEPPVPADYPPTYWIKNLGGLTE